MSEPTIGMRKCTYCGAPIAAGDYHVCGTPSSSRVELEKMLGAAAGENLQLRADLKIALEAMRILRKYVPLVTIIESEEWSMVKAALALAARERK